MSLRSSGWPGTHTIDKAGLELIEIHQMSHECWDSRCDVNDVMLTARSGAAGSH